MPVFNKNNSKSKIIRFGIISKKLVKKLGKSKKLAKSKKKLSKIKILLKIEIKKARLSFLTFKAKINFNNLCLAFIKALNF